MFGAFQLIALRLDRRTLGRIGVGLVYTYIGLVLFLTGANVGFMPAGNYLGQVLAGSSLRWIIIPIGMLIGYFIVKAEPAVYVLKQTGRRGDRRCHLGAGHGSGAFRRRVSISVGLAMVRVLTGISILWFLVPGYVFRHRHLPLWCPKLYTAIAFDAGGVASGPMTATFLLPLAQGACVAVGGNIVTDAFRRGGHGGHDAPHHGAAHGPYGTAAHPQGTDGAARRRCLPPCLPTCRMTPLSSCKEAERDAALFFDDHHHRSPLYRRLFAAVQSHGVNVSMRTVGSGTAVQETLSTLGLEQTEKAVLLAVVTAESWQKIQKDLRRKMQIDVPGTGIAFIIPVSSIGGKRALQFLTEHQTLYTEGGKHLEGYPLRTAAGGGKSGLHRLHYGRCPHCRCRRRYGDPRKGDRHGGCSRLSGRMELVNEKELGLIVSRTSQKNTIMKGHHGRGKPKGRAPSCSRCR